MHCMRAVNFIGLEWFGKFLLRFLFALYFLTKMTYYISSIRQVFSTSWTMRDVFLWCVEPLSYLLMNRTFSFFHSVWNNFLSMYEIMNHPKMTFYNLRQRPYHVECTASRPISEVKQRWVLLLLGWVTAWEHQMLLAFASFFDHHLFFKHLLTEQTKFKFWTSFSAQTNFEMNWESRIYVTHATVYTLE